jgi:ATP-dependent protease ClpP protease subunit
VKTKKFDFTRRNRRTKAVENVGHMEIRNAEGGAELYIYGDIVSTEWDAWTPEDTFPQGISNFLSQIDNDAPLTVYINSGGGDVFAGIAIHSILKRHTGRKKGVVDALAASIASVILMACDDIVVNSGAQIMIHKPSTVGWGNADDFQKLIGELDKCQQSITEIYMGRVKDGVTVEQITEMINAETWMNGAEAQDIFDLSVEQRPAMAACVSGFMDAYKHKPADIKTAEITEFEDAAEREAAEILEDLYLYGT